MAVAQCPHCGAVFRDQERPDGRTVDGRDYLADHISDEHPPALPNIQVLEGSL